jgi:fructose-1,6-bisphosphatase/inositol monophosphatase family enzyme
MRTLDNDFFIQVQGLLERIVRARKKEILSAHGKIEADYKSDTTPVTDLDMSLERDIRAGLKEFDSTIGLWGEEYGREGSEETFWLIDPIDGTDSFVRGLPNFRTMITLIDDNEPVFAFVYKYATDELYVAAKGDGTYRNGVRVQMVERPMSNVVLEFSGDAGAPNVTDVWRDVYKKIFNYKMGNFLEVVEGKLDGNLVYKSLGKEWDYAPRALLMSEAGAKVTNIGSDKYDYRNNDFLAAHPSIFDELMDTIVAAIKTPTPNS